MAECYLVASLVTSLNPLRSWVRKNRLLRFILRSIPRGPSHPEWCREYAANPVTQMAMKVGSLSCNILTEDADEYCKLKMCWSDEKILRFLVSRLRPGDQCWDIGASIGVYSVILGKAVGPQGRVLSFEPEPRSLGRIKANGALNGLNNIEAVNLALGSERASTSLFVTKAAASGVHSLFSGNEFDFSVPVDVYPGDLWRKENAQPVPNALKVDVEGFEEEVLKGLRETLNDERCRTVLCEVHFAILEANGRKDTPANLEKMLQAAGFKISWIDLSHLAGRKP